MPGGPVPARRTTPPPPRVGTRGRAPADPARPGAGLWGSMSIPMLHPSHTELGVACSQSQKHKSFMHDWKKSWRGSVMTNMNLSRNHCLLSWVTKEVPKSHCARRWSRKSDADTCPKRLEVGW